VLSPSTVTAQPLRLGLKENAAQFRLLVVVNAFVGGLVGVERVVLPVIAERSFGLASHTAILSFLVSFGLVKACSNLMAGRVSETIGRKRVLVAGWLFGLPVPLLIGLAPSWGWIVFANVLLGVNQGLCWSTTVIMKIDLVGPRRRGLAMGLNEASGYLAVSLAAFGAGALAPTLGLRLAPMWLGETLAVAGLILSLLLVHETLPFSRLEAALGSTQAGAPSFWHVFRNTSWGDRSLFAVCQAGLVNNLNDALAWGLLPLFFAANGLALSQISILSALYPATWGITQLGTGALSDVIGRKSLIASGMVLQGVAILLFVLTTGFSAWSVAAVSLGIGTAMVYPTLLAAIGDSTLPSWRATAIGVYRLWRDSGYAFGAILAGIIADQVGIRGAIAAVGVLTLFSGFIVAVTMRPRHPSVFQ
jgi:MFS family permease